MPGQIRPIPALTKVAYKILKTTKEQQQRNTHVPTERQRKEWASTYTKANIR